METSNIEEATVIDETANLNARLKQATEFKTPGTNNAAKTATQTKAGNAWNAPDDFEEVKPKPKPTGSGTTPEPDADAPKKPTDKMKRASARMGTNMYDTFQRGVFTVALNIKTKNKLNKLDPEKLELVAEVNKATLTGEAFQLRDKLDKILDARDKKMNRVPMGVTEKHDMEEMLYNYCDATDTVLSPAWGLVFSFGSSFGQRLADVFTD